MNSFSPQGQSVLKNATSQQLEQAVAYNHHELFCLNAISQGGEAPKTDGLTWTWCGPGRGGMVSFPSLTEETASKALDAMMDYFRRRQAINIGCWSLNPSQPSDLGIRLLARGFHQGWQPCWMALELDKINTNHFVPVGLEIVADNLTSIDNVKNLPYAGDNGAMSHALMQAHSHRAKRFIATLHGKIVAHSCVFLSTGEFGTAGIYNLGVLPGWRQQGIGKAVVTAACLYAKENGYCYAVLNATGSRMYEQLGFQWINNGLTWWLLNKNYYSDPPSSKQVMMAEATGKGDISLLNSLINQVTANDINTPLSNGMTLLQLAIHYQQTIAAEWLISNGAICSALDAWDLGWKEQAATLLSSDPQQVNNQYTERQTTLLHIAADRNDISLAKLALSAKPDLSIRDTLYNNTALGWAKHLQRIEIARMIESYRDRDIF